MKFEEITLKPKDLTKTDSNINLVLTNSTYYRSTHVLKHNPNLTNKARVGYILYSADFNKRFDTLKAFKRFRKNCDSLVLEQNVITVTKIKGNVIKKLVWRVN